MMRRLMFFLLAGFALSGAQSAPPPQPVLGTRSKSIIEMDGLRFRDLNTNGRLDPYEDWRLSAQQRATDLVGRMTLAEKVGMMMIATNNPDCDGTITPRGRDLIDNQKLTRFILRAKVMTAPADCKVKLTGFALYAGYPQTPDQMAKFTNAVQERLETGRLGIPGLFKDNARNHVETNPTFGIGAGAGAFTEFPKEAGLAAAALGAGAPVNARGMVPARIRADMAPLRSLTDVMGREWRAIGLRGMYGYMADLGTEPRWSRFHETFTENADLMSDIVGTLIGGLQGPVRADGTSLSPASSIALSIKHFPGGGPQEMGLDPHYTFGKRQVYTDSWGKYGFAYHLKPFRTAIAKGASSIMPYYGVPINLTYEGVTYDQRGMAFSKQVVTDLLRAKLDFKGYVNSDSGIIEQRGWGLESYRTNPETGKPYDIADRVVVAIRSGTDILSEFTDARMLTNLVQAGRLGEATQIDPAVRRLLTEQFQLGLFENPYVDAPKAADNIGRPDDRATGLDVQRRSIVLLENRNALLPLKAGAKVYVMGFGADAARASGLNVTDGNTKERPPVPGDIDALLIKVMVNPTGARAYSPKSPDTGGRAIGPEFNIMDPRTGKRQATWGAQDPCVYDPGAPGAFETPDGCLDSGLIFGGGFPWEVNIVTLSDLAKAQSWKMTPSLPDIQAAMREAGDPAKAVISIYFRNPYVLDKESRVRNAGALLATFGASDRAQFDIITGKAAPEARLPFALPATRESVLRQHPDAPGYADTRDGALYPYGFGRGFGGKGKR
ncbi:glycoside hydrolase family 3 protein [Sphingobium sp. HWE2-09]|uniref:glycoside hydrolase family 3 protein n=1 Tax=Sphingobium sp. HWE2-09 TaxID=3108390 RepID=UPI002DC56696|nr:glycoside hydrolase family 3 N-terminal domain-containing protein [Sphingobium sp. HWE2-09]